MRWIKEKIRDNCDKNIDCWRSKCGKYLIYLNANKGINTKKGEEDRNGHKWWYELLLVHEAKETFDIYSYDEKHLGFSGSLKGAKMLADIEEEEKQEIKK